MTSGRGEHYAAMWGLRLMSSMIPRALVIEDDRSHILSAQVLLEAVGFAPVEVADTLQAGADRLYTLLDSTQPFAPTLVLLDIKLPVPQCPGLEGIVLAAQAIEAMEAGRLHPAHLVILSSVVTDRRRRDAELAGCSEIHDKSLKLSLAQHLRALVDTPRPCHRLWR